MALIVLKMRTGSLGWVMGECALLGYETMISVNHLSFGIDVKSVFAEDGRRTVHLPALSRFSLQRKVDLATANITKCALAAKISPFPWTLYFLRPLGNNHLLQVSQICDLELTLDRPLVTDQNISFSGDDMSETLEITASAVEWTYRTHNSAGWPMGKVAYKFDVQQGWVE